MSTLRYCLLKDGRQMVVFTDNEDTETMHVFPVSHVSSTGEYDPEQIMCEEVPYSNISCTDCNRIVAYMCKR